MARAWACSTLGPGIVSPTVRFLTRATGDQMVTVVAGPEAGLRAMTEAGLLVPGPADRAMAKGKAFEERVIRKLQGSQ